MKKMFIIVLIFSSLLFAAHITLVDGTKIEGEIINASAEEIQVKVIFSEELITIKRSKILDISFKELMSIPKDTQRKISGDFLTQVTKSIDTPAKVTPDFSKVSYRVTNAGKNLTDFSKKYYFSVALELAGYILLLAAQDQGTATLGGIFVLGGGIGQFLAFFKVGEAGKELELAGEELKKLK